MRRRLRKRPAFSSGRCKKVTAGTARLGRAWPGMAWLGTAGAARQGGAGRGRAGQGAARQARQGMAGPGWAGRGAARRGKDRGRCESTGPVSVFTR